ncbi:hypothetical protein MFIFM68171_09710 [Madurella fahalii]|uniref:Uncharacterized protein n=1 Tax=Madurella fahalii TaxID=1157608 RepID=A0ABQ0GP47_9PEZI
MALDFVDRQSRRTKDKMGWYDQYAKLANTMNIKDIILGLKGETIIAAALTYHRNTGSPVSNDLPWAGTIAEDVGGVTCICIGDVVSRDTIMVRLLESCIRVLKDQGMNRLFLDAVKPGDEGFQSLSFREWARYTKVWQDC